MKKPKAPKAKATGFTFVPVQLPERVEAAILKDAQQLGVDPSQLVTIVCDFFMMRRRYAQWPDAERIIAHVAGKGGAK